MQNTHLATMRAPASYTKRPEAKTPLINAVLAAGKASGKPYNEVMTEFSTNESSYPGIGVALAAHKAPVAQASNTPSPRASTPTAKVASSTSTVIVTAADYTRKDLVTMARAEFLKMPDKDRSRFIREGGKLI